MSFFPKSCLSKNDHPIIIRQAVSDDAPAVLQLKKNYLANTKTLPLFADEYPNDTDQEKEMIERYQSEKNSLLLLAISDHIVIGNIDLTGSCRKKMQHTEMIGMGIHTHYQNQGIGTLLFKNILDWANENKALKLIWLEVYATNTLGISLYNKMGFKTTGTIPDFFVEHQKYIDKITMYKEV